MLSNKANLDGALGHLQTFCRASGTMVNVGKSELLFLGSKVGMKNRWGFKEAKD